MISDQQLSDELDRLISQTAAVPRQRLLEEPPLELTNAYVDLIVASGHAWLGASDRALARAASARAALEGWLSDQVHRWLLAAFDVRIAQFLAADIDRALPQLLLDELASWHRVPRYKVDRFRETSRMLERFDAPDAIGAFSRRTPSGSGGSQRALPATAAEIEAMFGTLPEADRAVMLRDCLRAAGRLGESEAMPIVLRAIEHLPATVSRFAACGEAIRVCARFAWGELVPLVLPSLQEELPGVEITRRAVATISATLRGLVRLGLTDEMLDVMALAEDRLPEAPELTRASLEEELRYILAGAARSLDDRAAAQTIENTIKHKTDNVFVRLVLHRKLALAFAHGQPDRALELLPHLVPELRHVRDRQNTSTHYTLSVIEFVDALVHAITLLSITRG